RPPTSQSAGVPHHRGPHRLVFVCGVDTSFACAGGMPSLPSSTIHRLYSPHPGPFFSKSTQKMCSAEPFQQNQQLHPLADLRFCTETVQFLCSFAHCLCNCAPAFKAG